MVGLAPRVLGEPVQRLVRVAQHVSCEESENLLTNTRTTLTNGGISALASPLPYHAEHHLLPNVPFFRLPTSDFRVCICIWPRKLLSNREVIWMASGKSLPNSRLAQELVG